MPELSIVIPTRTRPQILRRCLDHIEKQTICNNLEVIIVIDGHDAKTAEMISSLHWPFPLQCFAIPKSQQGVARNAGVKKARGSTTLFIGDDIFLAPDACERHMHTYKRTCHPEPIEGSKYSTTPVLRPSRFLSGQAQYNAAAVLGFTTWDPSLEITPVMRWLEESGWQFGYSHISQYAHTFIPENLQHRFTYTSHISLPTKLAWKIPFREDISLYGWEDIEWGMRLRDEGIKLLYEPSAKALHHHTISKEESLKRMETLGQSALRFQALVPEFDRIPQGWKRAGYSLLSLLPTLRGKHYKAFLRGIREGKKNLHGHKTALHYEK